MLSWKNESRNRSSSGSLGKSHSLTILSKTQLELRPETFKEAVVSDQIHFENMHGLNCIIKLLFHRLLVDHLKIFLSLDNFLDLCICFWRFKWLKTMFTFYLYLLSMENKIWILLFLLSPSLLSVSKRILCRRLL